MSEENTSEVGVFGTVQIECANVDHTTINSLDSSSYSIFILLSFFERVNVI